MRKPSYPYRKFLQGVVSTRKFLIRTGRSRKSGSYMDQVIMLAEVLLNRQPSEETVRAFCRKYYAQIKALIPSRGSNDKRIETLNRIVNA